MATERRDRRVSGTPAARRPAAAGATIPAVVVGLSAVTVSRAGRVVLGEVELAVRAGEVAVVEGADGSGKTSLLRVLAGSAAPAAGTVRRAAGPWAFVPERVALAPRLAPLDWLRAMDGVRGVLVVSDEPWAGLDAGGRDLLARRLRARADQGAAVVLADHSGARRGRVRAHAIWQVDGGAVTGARDAAPEMVVVATQEGKRVEHLAARGAHDALLARLLGDGWSIESVRER